LLLKPYGLFGTAFGGFDFSTFCHCTKGFHEPASSCFEGGERKNISMDSVATVYEQFDVGEAETT